MWSHAVAVSLLASKIDIKNYQNMGPKLAPRHQVYVPDKPANEAGSPVVIRVSEDRQWLSEYQRIASGYQSISHQTNYRYPVLG